MKKQYLIPGAAVLIIVVIGIVLAIALSVRSQVKTFTLIVESGNVLYKTSENGNYEYIEEDEVELVSGTFIKTETDSYARIFFPDNSLVSLDENTETQINFVGENIDIKQFIGKTWNRVQTVTQGNEFQIETPNTIAAVRGTIFGVGVDNDNHSRVFVEESKVEVSKHENGQVLESLDVNPNQLVNVIKGDQSFDMILSEPGDDFKNTFWFKRNKIIDEEIQKISNIKNIDLKKTLKENLQKREDYIEYKFVRTSSKVDLQKIQAELASVYSLARITEDTCTTHSQNDIQSSIELVRKYNAHINNASAIVALLKELKDVCVDGEMDHDEALKLQGLIDIANE